MTGSENLNVGAFGPSEMIAGSGKMMRQPKFITIEEQTA
jgi:hypothetical protein